MRRIKEVYAVSWHNRNDVDCDYEVITELYESEADAKEAFLKAIDKTKENEYFQEDETSVQECIKNGYYSWYNSGRCLGEDIELTKMDIKPASKKNKGKESA